MATTGSRIYIHEPTYHDGETGTIVSGKNKFGQYEVELDVGGTAYVADNEFEIVEEEIA